MSSADKKIILDFIFSMKWLWVIVFIYTVKLANKYINAINYKTNIERDKLIKDTPIDTNILDFIDASIQDIIDEYFIYKIKSKDIVYINSKMEDDLRKYVSSEVSNRLSPTVLNKLKYICNEEYIPTLIGNKICFAVLDRVLTTNTTYAKNKND